MRKRTCSACFGQFRPKPMGFNARYCSAKCKASRRIGPSIEKRRANGRVTYRQIKTDPVRNSGRLRYDADSKTALRQWLADLKLASGCIDCGYRKNSAALQFDHEGKKTACISELRTSRARILREIGEGKCVVRCANCHAERTWAQRTVSK